MNKTVNNTLDFRLNWCREISNFDAKQDIAHKVALNAKNGDIIGAGSGSTSFLTVLALAERAKADNLKIIIVPTSIEIELACNAVGLDVLNNIPLSIDWCFDGADEIDPQNRILKGRGGALFRERLVFAPSKKRFVVADDSKSVERLGQNFAVPVEIDKSCVERTFQVLSDMKNVDAVNLRMGVNKDGPIITESGRLILDVKMSYIDNEDELRILSSPGVSATGIFSGFEFQRIA